MARNENHFAFVRFEMLGEQRAFCLAGNALDIVEMDGPLFERFMAMVERKSATAEAMQRILTYALIGGGMATGKALVLAQRQIAERPLGEALALCVGICEAALFGNADYQAAQKARESILAHHPAGR